MVANLKATIRTHCPDATFATMKNEFVAKFDTTTYTLHARAKTGEVYEKTHQEEGPNFKGFILRVELREGKYDGGAVVPATLQGPYYPTFIDGANLNGKHHWVSFSYGGRLNSELKMAIMGVNPRTQFKKGQ
jgi:hypothetical protein